MLIVSAMGDKHAFHEDFYDYAACCLDCMSLVPPVRCWQMFVQTPDVLFRIFRHGNMRRTGRHTDGHTDGRTDGRQKSSA